MPMPTPSVTRLVRSATTLMACSSAFGTSNTRARPTAGTKIASVRPHSWNQFICRRPLTEDGDREGDDAHGSEQEECVALESTRLQRPEQAAGGIGLAPDRVDGTVDPTLVHEAVHDPPHGGRAATGVLHDRVDHVGVHPVRRTGDRALDAGDDDALVQVVEVVLVDEERVPRLRRVRARGEALEPAQLLAVEPEEEADADRDHHDRERDRGET